MPAGTFSKNNMLMKDEVKPQNIARLCRRSWNTENLHIVVIFWPLKALTTTYCVICMSSVESCLCRKAPREFPRGRPRQWVEKTTKYRWFRTFWTAKNWKKIQSGVRHKCGSYSSVKLESWQIALCEAEILLLVVQNEVKLRLLCPEKALVWMRR